MDIKTYNALMGASSITFPIKPKEKTTIEFEFSVALKMKFAKLSGEDAVAQTASERHIGMLSAFIPCIIGMLACFLLVWQSEREQIELLLPLFLGYAPLVYAHVFSHWWHKTHVIRKEE